MFCYVIGICILYQGINGHRIKKGVKIYFVSENVK